MTYEELSAEEIFALPPREVLQNAAALFLNIGIAAGGSGGAGGAGGTGGTGGAGGGGGDAGTQQTNQVQAASAQAVD